MPISPNHAAALDPEAPTGPAVYRHKKRGTTYRLIGFAVREADQEPMVVYQDTESGIWWTRPDSEFFDGRFEIVPNPCLREGDSA